jgi:hypothetical protein
MGTEKFRACGDKCQSAMRDAAATVAKHQTNEDPGRIGRGFRGKHAGFAYRPTSISIPGSDLLAPMPQDSYPSADVGAKINYPTCRKIRSASADKLRQLSYDEWERAGP